MSGSPSRSRQTAWPAGTPIGSTTLLYKELLTALDRAGVRHVIVGGIAVVLHGHVRATIDLDLAISLTPSNIEATIEVLQAQGFVPRVPVDPRDLSDDNIREGWIRDKGMKAFTLLHPDRPMEMVDLLIDSPVEFEDLHRRGVEVDLGSLTVRIASIPDLISMKQHAGRPQDLADIAALRHLRSDD